MVTPSSPSEPSASSDRPATARAKWRAKTQAPAPLAIMPSTTALVGAGKGGHVDLADPAEIPAERGAHMTEEDKRAAQTAFDAARRAAQDATIAAANAAPRRSLPLANLSGESHRAEPRPPAWHTLTALPSDARPDSRVSNLKNLYEQIGAASDQLGRYPPNQIYGMYEKLPFSIEDLRGLPLDARTARTEQVGARDHVVSWLLA